MKRDDSAKSASQNVSLKSQNSACLGRRTANKNGAPVQIEAARFAWTWNTALNCEKLVIWRLSEPCVEIVRTRDRCDHGGVSATLWFMHLTPALTGRRGRFSREGIDRGAWRRPLQRVVRRLFQPGAALSASRRDRRRKFLSSVRNIRLSPATVRSWSNSVVKSSLPFQISSMM